MPTLVHFRLVTTILMAGTMACFADIAHAQRGGGGDRGGDDDRRGEWRRDRGDDDRRGGDRDDDDNDDRGRGRDDDDRRGGDRGGDRRDGDRRGGFDPTEMLRRMDRDRNGRLEGDELEGRGGEFVKRSLSGTGLENQGRISVDDAAKAIQKLREQRDAGVSAASMSFGEPDNTTPAATFDAPPPQSGPPLEERFDARVLEYVDRMMERYDANKNHYLDGPEWGNMRWRGNPADADTNKDSRLSREEIATSLSSSFGGGRESRGRDSDEQQRGSGEDSGGGDDRYRRYAEGLLRQNDGNKNGVLEKDEWSRMRGNPSEWDKNNDAKLSVDEIAAGLEGYGQRRAGGDSRGEGDSRRGGRWGSRDDRGDSRRGENDRPKQATYRFLSPAERLPGGLPDWFLRNDRDGDGQIMMHEYSTSWSSSKVAEFDSYDLNGDGVITAKECLESGRS